MSKIKTIENWAFFSAIENNSGDYTLLNSPLFGIVNGKDVVTSRIIGKTSDGLGVVSESGTAFMLGPPAESMAARYPDFHNTVLSRLPYAVDVVPDGPRGPFTGSIDLEL